MYFFPLNNVSCTFPLPEYTDFHYSNGPVHWIDVWPSFPDRNYIYIFRASWMMLVVKNLPANAGDIRDADAGWIPGWGRSLGGGHGNPLRSSCPGNPMDRGTSWAIMHRVAKSWTRLKQLSAHAHMCVCICICGGAFCSSLIINVLTPILWHILMHSNLHYQ